MLICIPGYNKIHLVVLTISSQNENIYKNLFCTK